MVNWNAGTMVNTTFAEDVIPPPVAVTIIVAICEAAVALAAIVNTLVPDPGAEKLFDANAAVTPAGIPLTDSVTRLLNPPATPIFAVDAPLPPCTIVNDPTDISAVIDGGTVIAVSPQKFARLDPFTEPSPLARS